MSARFAWMELDWNTGHMKSPKHRRCQPMPIATEQVLLQLVYVAYIAHMQPNCLLAIGLPRSHSFHSQKKNVEVEPHTHVV